MNQIVAVSGKPSILATMAARYGVDAEKMLDTLKETAFRGNVSNSQMMALLIVAQQYNLNPWTKEIYAFPDRNGIVPVVGVDGWARIINEHPQCNGIQFNEAEDGSWIECTIYRKDREHATTAREWLSECRRDTAPWKSHPRRMLRHKSLIQCARIAFGFGGIYDQDEAERIIDVTPTGHVSANPRDGLDLASVDPQTVDGYISRVADALALESEEEQVDALFRVHLDLNKQGAEVYTRTLDEILKGRKLLKRKNWDESIALGSRRYQSGEAVRND